MIERLHAQHHLILKFSTKIKRKLNKITNVEHLYAGRITLISVIFSSDPILKILSILEHLVQANNYKVD